MELYLFMVTPGGHYGDHSKECRILEKLVPFRPVCSQSEARPVSYAGSLRSREDTRIAPEKTRLPITAPAWTGNVIRNLTVPEGFQISRTEERDGILEIVPGRLR
jgi:hypothetical protein